eukprot:tig00020614_g12216.t1
MAAADLVLQAPPGSLDAVFRDVSVLAGAEGLDGFARHWDVAHCISIPMAEEQPLLVCDVAELEEGRFYNPRSSEAVTVDHATRTCTAREPRDPSFPELEAHRRALDAAIRKYLLRIAPDAHSGVYATAPDALAVRISSTKSKQTSFWGGEWISRWTVRVTAGGEGASVAGQVDALVHSFEDGNVQLRVSEPCGPADVAFPRGDAEAFAGAVAGRVEEAEAGVHRGVLESLEGLSRSTWKEFRRKLPITGASFDWSKAQNYRLAHELQSKI